MLIVVEKIITKYKQDGDGKNIINPVNDRLFPDGFKIEREAICLEEVKAARVWHKNKYQEAEIKGGITVLYMLDLDRDKKVKGKPAEIQINENFEDFNKRAGSILVPDSSDLG